MTKQTLNHFILLPATAFLLSILPPVNASAKCFEEVMQGEWKIYRSNADLKGHIEIGDEVIISYQKSAWRISGGLGGTPVHGSWNLKCNNNYVLKGRVDSDGCQHKVTITRMDDHADNTPEVCDGLTPEARKKKCDKFVLRDISRHVIIDVKKGSGSAACTAHETAVEHELAGDHGGKAHGGDQ